MTLEEALISLGSHPLSKSPYSQVIQSIVKATLGKRGETINKETPGYIVLGMIYKVTNPEKRNSLLMRRLGAVRSSDLYKQVVLGSAALLVFVAIVVSLIEVLSDAPVSGDYADVFKTAIQGFFEILKLVLSSNADAST